MLHLASLYARFLDQPGAITAKGLVHVTGELDGNLTLGPSYPNVMLVDPNGARDITLDPEEGAEGLLRVIGNAASAAENITVKTDGGATVCTVNQNDVAVLYCDGSTWALFGMFTRSAT